MGGTNQQEARSEIDPPDNLTKEHRLQSKIGVGVV